MYTIKGKYKLFGLAFIGNNKSFFIRLSWFCQIQAVADARERLHGRKGGYKSPVSSCNQDRVSSRFCDVP